MIPEAEKRLQKVVKDKNGKKLVDINSITSNIEKNLIHSRVNKCSKLDCKVRMSLEIEFVVNHLINRNI